MHDLVNEIRRNVPSHNCLKKRVYDLISNRSCLVGRGLRPRIIPDPVYLRHVSCRNDIPLCDTLGRIYQHDPAAFADEIAVVAKSIESIAARGFNGSRSAGNLAGRYVGADSVSFTISGTGYPGYLLHQA